MNDRNDDLESVDTTDTEGDSRQQLWDTFEAEDTGAPRDDDDDHQEDDDTAGDDDKGDDDDQWGDGSGDGEEEDPEGDGDGDGADDDGTDGAADETPEEQIKRLQQALRSSEGRAKGQQRAAEASRREIAELKAQIAKADASASRSKTDDAKQQERRERLAAVQEEYGEVIGPLAEMVAELNERHDELSARELADLDAKKGRLDELYKQEADLFSQEHPDGFDTLRDNWPTFKTWIEDQPKAVRDIYHANAETVTDGTQAAYLVSLFKQELAQPGESENRDKIATRRSSQLAGARSTRSQTQRRPSSRPSPDATPEAAWDYFESLDRKKQGAR